MICDVMWRFLTFVFWVWWNLFCEHNESRFRATTNSTRQNAPRKNHSVAVLGESSPDVAIKTAHDEALILKCSMNKDQALIIRKQRKLLRCSLLLLQIVRVLFHDVCSVLLWISTTAQTNMDLNVSTMGKASVFVCHAITNVSSLEGQGRLVTHFVK